MVPLATPIAVARPRRHLAAMAAGHGGGPVVLGRASPAGWAEATPQGSPFPASPWVAHQIGGALRETWPMRQEEP